jgi:hypothetical protein
MQGHAAQQRARSCGRDLPHGRASRRLEAQHGQNSSEAVPPMPRVVRRAVSAPRAGPPDSPPSKQLRCTGAALCGRHLRGKMRCSALRARRGGLAACTAALHVRDRHRRDASTRLRDTAWMHRSTPPAACSPLRRACRLLRPSLRRRSTRQQPAEATSPRQKPKSRTDSQRPRRRSAVAEQRAGRKGATDRVAPPPPRGLSAQVPARPPASARGFRCDKPAR